MKFIVEVEEGGTAPRGYGLAWRDFRRPYIYFAPIPFHLVIAPARRLWHRFKYPNWKLTRGDLLALEKRRERSG